MLGTFRLAKRNSRDLVTSCMVGTKLCFWNVMVGNGVCNKRVRFHSPSLNGKRLNVPIPKPLPMNAAEQHRHWSPAICECLLKTNATPPPPKKEEKQSNVWPEAKARQEQVFLTCLLEHPTQPTETVISYTKQSKRLSAFYFAVK